MKTFSDSVMQTKGAAISEMIIYSHTGHALLEFITITLNNANILAGTQLELIPFKTISIQNNEMVCLTCKFFDVVL